MIKSDFTQEKISVVHFPKLMIAKSTGYIILFLKEEVGTVVGFSKTNSMNVPMGYIGYEWNMEDFVDFNGTVTLENI